MVGEQLAVGLEQDRERAVALGHGQQRLCAQALLPERRALPGAPARDQQCARSALAEARPEQRRAAELADDEILDAIGVDRDQLVRRQRVRIGEVEDDPVVRPERVRLDAVLLAQQARAARAPRARAPWRRTARGCRAASRRSRRGSARRRSCGRRGGRRWPAPARAGTPRGARRALVAGVQARQALHRAWSSAQQARAGGGRLRARARAAGRPAHPSRTAPARLAGRGGDDHAVALDLLDAPGRRTQKRTRPSRASCTISSSSSPTRRRRRPGTRRRGRGRGSCRRSRSRCAALPRGRAANPSCAPTRCAGAARRTRPTDSARRAGRARSPAARA